MQTEKLPAAVELGRLGGSAKSEAKSAAARANGALGGRPARMKLIRQLNGIDCGIAVVAMVARCSYARARNSDPTPEKSIGLSIAEFLLILARCSGHDGWSVEKPLRYIPLKDHTDYTRAVGAIIRAAGEKYGHWIAIENEFIFDPEMDEKKRVNDYNRRDWLVIRWVLRK